jgi:hypothetical protein
MTHPPLSPLVWQDQGPCPQKLIRPQGINKAVPAYIIPESALKAGLKRPKELLFPFHTPKQAEASVAFQSGVKILRPGKNQPVKYPAQIHQTSLCFDPDHSSEGSAEIFLQSRRTYEV